jgi:ribosomal protein S12 methylthiotransferase
VVEVLVEAAEDEDEDSPATGRAAHQAPEVDGECVVESGAYDAAQLQPGDIVRCVVVDVDGADLIVAARELVSSADRTGGELAAAGASVTGTA